MAKGDIQVQIKGNYNDKDINRAIRDLNALKTQAGATAGPMAGLGKTAIAAGAGLLSLAAVGKVVDFMRDAAGAAMEEEAAIASLSRALDNLGLKSQLPAAEAGIKRLSKMAAVADDELRPAFQTLVTATGNVARSQELLQTALDASAATGRPLEAVVLAISKASTGQVSALKRLGIPLDDNIVKTKDFAAAIDVMNEKFGGQAATAAKTMAGQMKALGIAVDEAKETIGFALIDALSNASDAFGGTDGLTTSIEDFAEKIAGAIKTTSGLVGILGDIKAKTDDLTASLQGNAEAASGWFDWALDMLPGALELVNVFRDVATAGDLWNASQVTMADVAPSATNAYVRMSGTMADLANTTGDVTGATEDAAEATKDLATANDLLKASIDRITTKDDLTTALRNMGKAAREAKGDITGHKDASIDLRAELGNAATAALGFAQTMGTSAQDTYNIFTRKVQAMKDNLIANKVSPKDAEAWLNKVTWQAQFQLLADAIGKGPAAEAMRLAGMAAGKRAWQGIVQGLRDGQDNVATAAGNVAAAANRGAQAALDAHSPSRVWRGLGLDATKGFELGLEDGTADLVSSAADLIAKVTAGAAQAAKQSADSALDAVRGVSDSIVGQVLGGVGFSTSDAEGNALSPEQMISAWFGSIADRRQVVDTIASYVGTTLPPELVQQLLSAEPATAMAMAKLLGKDNAALATQLALAYDELGVFTQEALGIPMGLAWAKVGDQSAKDMLAAARELIKERRDTFTAWVAQSLAVTIPVNFSTPGIPGRANGGPVTGGAPYIVGERGPELFVPSQSGTIVPNNRSVGGKSYNITVNAGVGDPRQIGQQIVEYVRRFEQSNGSVWSAA